MTHNREFINSVKMLIKKYSSSFDFITCRFENAVKISIFMNNEYVKYNVREIYSGGHIQVCKDGVWSKSIISKPCVFDIESVLKDFVNRSFNSNFCFNDINQNLLWEWDSSVYSSSLLTNRIDELMRVTNEFLMTECVHSVQIDFQEIRKKRCVISTNKDIIEDFQKYGTYNCIPTIDLSNNKINMIKNFAFSTNSEIDIPDVKNIVKATLGKYLEVLPTRHISSGKYDVILDQEVCAYIIHEMLGHLLESDLLYNHPELMRSKIKIGKKISNKKLKIIDDPTMDKKIGSYKYDDEGNIAKKVVLVDNGIIKSYMNNEHTSDFFNHNNNGHGRSNLYNIPVSVRMSNTYIEPGDSTFEDMVSSIEDGLYFKGSMYAKTDIETFQVYPREAYIIHDGKIGELIFPPIIRGNIHDFLSNIDLIGNDLIFYSLGCTKGYSSAWIPVEVGGVHLKVNHFDIGHSIL